MVAPVGRVTLKMTLILPIPWGGSVTSSLRRRAEGIWGGACWTRVRKLVGNWSLSSELSLLWEPLLVTLLEPLGDCCLICSCFCTCGLWLFLAKKLAAALAWI